MSQQLAITAGPDRDPGCFYTVIGHWIGDDAFTIGVIAGKRKVHTGTTDLEFFPDGLWTTTVWASGPEMASTTAEEQVVFDLAASYKSARRPRGANATVSTAHGNSRFRTRGLGWPDDEFDDEFWGPVGDSKGYGEFSRWAPTPDEVTLTRIEFDLAVA
jgi:hypothetical protein